MDYKLIIIQKINLALLYSDSKVLSLLTEHKTYPINKIYLGKISNIVSSLNAAFISKFFTLTNFKIQNK